MPHPNILVMMSDQHARPFAGCYANSLIRTPNLDRLASEGTRFTNAYCASPVCVPSRMSFMTGRLPGRNRVWNNQGVLSSGIPTWPHALGAAGYETTLIGRMHFLGSDQRHGFMKRPIGEGNARHLGAPELGGPRYTRIPNATAGHKRDCFEYAGRGPSFYQHYDGDVTDETCRFLREQAGADQPFAAVTGYILPHCPFIGPKGAFDYYYDRVPTAPEIGGEPECIQSLHETRRLHPRATEKQIRVARAAYYAMIECVDANVGRILDALEATGLADNTLVVYCSDHGEMLGEHGVWSKKCFYDQSAGVPLITRLPNVTEPGTVCDDLCSLIDLAPTFAELGDGPEMDVDGESLIPLWNGESAPDRTVIAEVADLNGGIFEWLGRMVRQGPWKLWQHISADGEPWDPVLFDLDEDPDERNNLADDPAHAARVESMSEDLNEGWDPDAVRGEVGQQMRDVDLLKTWGRRVQPPHPDTYTWPGPKVEGEMEVLMRP
jgi:choline-sulfatase